MTESSAPSPRGFNAKAFLFAALSAPGSAFLIFLVLAVATGDLEFGGLDFRLMLGAPLLLALTMVWGALPAAGFGAAVLAPLERLFPRGAPVAALIPAGLFAAGLYAAVSIQAGLNGQQWALLFAPWVGGLLGREEESLYAFAPLVVSIVLSGGVGAIVYARLAHRFSVRPA